MNASSPERVGIVIAGFGEWGPNHVRVFRELRGVEVIGIVDLDPDRRRAAADRYPGLEVSESLERMLSNPAVDAVVVSSPTATHYDLCRKALEAGRHVLCEKPLALTTTEAEALVGLARSVSRVLAVGHVFLYNPGILKLKALLGSGELGRLQILRSTRTNLGPIRRDVGAVYDLASHDVSIFNFLLGAVPNRVSAVGQCFLRPGVEDVAVATFSYPGDVIATVFVSWLDPRKIRFIAVTGDQRMATWDDLDRIGPIMIYDKGVRREEYRDFGEFRLLAREGDISIPKVAAREPLLLQAEEFLDCLRTGRSPVSDAAFGSGVVRVLEATKASIARAGAPIDIEVAGVSHG